MGRRWSADRDGQARRFARLAGLFRATLFFVARFFVAPFFVARFFVALFVAADAPLFFVRRSHASAAFSASAGPPCVKSPKNFLNFGRHPFAVRRYPMRPTHPCVRVTS